MRWDTVIPGVSGELFHEQTVESLAATLASFNWPGPDPAACHAQAERFSAQHFRHEIGAYLERLCISARIA